MDGAESERHERPIDREAIDRAARALDTDGPVVVITGAGMSRESGVPTFRDAQQGLWARFRPEEVATPEAFRRDPARVWGWYQYRRRLVAEAQPHAGHEALVRLAELLPHVALVTQNIDGLHQRAGSRDVTELHGNIHRFKCFAEEHPVETEVPISDEDGPHPPPECPACGSPIRPDVVWFGEPLPEGALNRAWQESKSCELMLVVGTSGLVVPAALLPSLARDAGADVIEVNTEPSAITPKTDVFLAGGAATVLPALVEAMVR